MESNILKSSILQFKSDVHKQAKRIMQSHDYTAMRASSSAAMLSASGNGARSISEQCKYKDECFITRYVDC